MAVKAAGLKGYVTSLITTILFPILWYRSWQFAKEHSQSDPRGSRKVTLAVLAAIILVSAGAYGLLQMRESAVDGIYESLDGRLAQATGEAEYQSFVEAKSVAEDQVALAQKNIAEAPNESERQKWESNLATFQADLAEAQEKISALTANHLLYNQVEEAVLAKDDARAKQLLATTNVEYADMDARSDRAFEIKDKAVADLDWTLKWILIPSIVGMFYAPLAFANGSILRTTWEPSESVGFRPYPSAAAGWFLLLGALGVPSVFFAAWVFQDVGARAEEGQISL